MLTAGAGPARRYREFLAVSRGTRRIVVGTRAAAFAPVHDLGLVAIWDDGDDLHAEPRAPYPHAREVLLTRAQLQDTAALVGGFARSVEADHLLTAGLGARDHRAPRGAPRRGHGVDRGRRPTSQLERDPLTHAARMPKQVHDAVAAGLARGPVLVQTPRRGYAPSLACERCRTPARCTVCTGPLAVAGPAAPPACRLVRHGRRRLGLCRVRPPRAPGTGPWASAVPPRSWAGPSPRTAGRGLGRRPRAGLRRRTGRRSWWPPRAPSRWPPAGTPRWSCSTPGWPWPAPTCAPRRRRCAAGSTPPRWSPRAARCSRSATRPTRRSRRWCAGTPPVSPGARGERALRGAPTAGQPARDDHRRARSRRRRRSPCSTDRPAPRSSARSRSATTASRGVVVRVPRAHGPGAFPCAGRGPARPLGTQARRRSASRSTRCPS